MAKRNHTSPEAQRELDAAATDYGTPAERQQRGAAAREQSGQARTNGNAGGATRHTNPRR